MKTQEIRNLLKELYQQKKNPDQVLQEISRSTFEDLGFARVDHNRKLRKGFYEVIFCPGKTEDQIYRIASEMLDKKSDVLATRISEEKATYVLERIPQAHHNAAARTLSILSRKRSKKGRITIISAGTSDIPVAEEARETCEIMGNRTEVVYDAGIAGIHRLLADIDTLKKARVIIVVAGMEGALPGVVGGIVSCPVIAVPTSVGYGTNFSGVAPLLTMLNTCAPGVAVVNIDNGFGAAAIASLINRRE